VPVIGTATAAGGGQWETEFTGIGSAEIHAVSGIWSHTGGQVCGSARATLANGTHVTSRPPALSIVARTRRTPLHLMSAQS
jgi:hypothetical protein